MEPEVLFLKYAFPCAFMIKERGEISEEELKRLEEAAINNKAVPREYLEKVFFRAFQKIVPISKELEKDKWDKDTINEYFRVRHNIIIDEDSMYAKKSPDALKNLCKVHEAKVLEIKGNIITVEYENGKRRSVISDLIPNVKEGDTVTIHYGYAAEKL